MSTFNSSIMNPIHLFFLLQIFLPSITCYIPQHLPNNGLLRILNLSVVYLDAKRLVTSSHLSSIYSHPAHPPLWIHSKSTPTHQWVSIIEVDIRGNSKSRRESNSDGTLLFRIISLIIPSGTADKMTIQHFHPSLLLFTLVDLCPGCGCYELRMKMKG